MKYLNLSHLINRSFECLTFPNILKHAVVIPIYKNGGKDNASNYRPISLITCLSKVYEKIFKTRLSSFVTKHKLINKNQFGFQNGKSTSDAIANLTADIYEAM